MLYASVSLSLFVLGIIMFYEFVFALTCCLSVSNLYQARGARRAFQSNIYRCIMKSKHIKKKKMFKKKETGSNERYLLR